MTSYTNSISKHMIQPTQLEIKKKDPSIFINLAIVINNNYSNKCFTVLWKGMYHVLWSIGTATRKQKLNKLDGNFEMIEIQGMCKQQILVSLNSHCSMTIINHKVDKVN